MGILSNQVLSDYFLQIEDPLSGSTLRPVIDSNDTLSALQISESTVSVDGAFDANSISSDSSISGATLSTTSNATIGGTLGVTGNSTLSGTLGVTGATTLSSTLNVADFTTIDSLQVNNGTSLSGATSIVDSLSCASSVTMNSTLSVSGNTTLSTLNATGQVDLSSTVNIVGTTNAGILNAGDTSVLELTTTSDASIGGALSVTGATTLSSTLAVTGNTTLSTLSVTSNVSIGGTLSISGNTAFNGTVTVNDSSTFGQPASFNSNLNANGFIVLNGTLYVVGSGPNRILYTNTFGNMTYSNDFEYDFTNEILNIGDPNNSSTHGKLQLNGTSGSVGGPHINSYLAASVNNVWQMLPWAHDDVSYAVDCYYDGTNWKSSSTSGNFRMVKTGGSVLFQRATGISAGSNISSWTNVFKFALNSGTLEVEEGLRLSSDGSDVQRIDAAVATLGTNTSGTNFKTFTVNFVNAFTVIPVLTTSILAESGTSLNDTFSHSIRSVSTTGFSVNVWRDDATDWSQSLRISYHAIEV